MDGTCRDTVGRGMPYRGAGLVDHRNEESTRGIDRDQADLHPNYQTSAEFGHNLNMIRGSNDDVHVTYDDTLRAKAHDPAAEQYKNGLHGSLPEHPRLANNEDSNSFIRQHLQTPSFTEKGTFIDDQALLGRLQ